MDAIFEIILGILDGCESWQAFLFFIILAGIGAGIYFCLC